MLKIVVNTRYDSAGTKVCVDDLIPRLKTAGHQVTQNDWTHYEQYDLALFMSPDAEPARAKLQNPNIKVGIANPMVDYPKLQANARQADFLIVGSLEQRDAQLAYNDNIFIYFMFPDIEPRPKIHKAKDPTIIGYHGNKEHLINFHPHINRALEQLATEHLIELWALYNVKKHGRWQRNLPQGVTVQHLQWSENAYSEQFSQCDIGIVNNAIPTSVGQKHRIYQPLTRYLRYETHAYRALDTAIRFKYSTNAGRIYPFSQLGIPVVADFAPSMSQVIQDGTSGFIVNSKEGWHWALKQLVTNPPLRQTLSNNLRNHIDHNISIDKNFPKLNDYLINICAKTAELQQEKIPT